MFGQENPSNYINLRSGISITPSQDKAIDQIVSTLLSKGPARFILVTDRTGQIVSACGSRGSVDMVAMGSLAAGDLAASEEIARITGEYQQNQMIMREGTKYHTIIYQIGAHLILILQVSCDVPLGWVRILVRVAAQEIDQVVSSPSESTNTEKLDFGNMDLGDMVNDALKIAWTD